MIKKIIFSIALFFTLTFGGVAVTLAQSTQDLSSINVDDLSDDQINKFIAQFQASGLPMSQLDQVAQARGMSPVQLQKLKARVESIQPGSTSANSIKDSDANNSQQKNQNGRNFDFNQSYQQADTSKVNTVDVEGLTLATLKSKIFGTDLFKNAKISFEPNLNTATPPNYQLAAGDELSIDVYGYSEASYSLKVSPEGKINIPYVGLISVGNMTIAQATNRIKKDLSKVYKAMNSGQTKLSVALSNVRGIKVILTGEIEKPGTYTLSSFSTVMNALYASGGPTQNGSFRKVSIIRGGAIIATVDIYDFLLHGELKNNVRLQDQDVIRVPTYQNRVEIIGQVKRPGIYELLDNENFSDVLNFTGGFNEFAYKARVKVLQNTDKERKIQDVTVDQFENYHPLMGDKIYVDKILDRFANRVTIGGAVFRPGSYSLEENTTLKQLLQSAEGVKEDAFKNRAYIIRKNTNSENSLITFNLNDILSGVKNIDLLREDSVSIASIYDLKENYTVKVNGEVRKPGEIPYAEGMTLNDVILRSGGFTEKGTSSRIEISNRIRNTSSDTVSNTISKIIEVDVNRNLSQMDKTYLIKPFDIVSIRQAPGYEVQRQVLIEGEVLYPGYYTLSKKDERISDVIKRAGGITQWAYLEGASLKRVDAIAEDKSVISGLKEQKKIAQFKKLQLDANDTVNLEPIEVIKNEFIGISLKRILNNPGSKNDVYLKNGDVLNVPVKNQTVTVSGEVLSPSKVIFIDSKGLKSYINNAGGFSNKADKGKVYVNYSNGGVLGTKKFLFFKNYPRLKPGAEIFVPKRQEKRKVTAAEAVGLSSGLVSVMAIIFTILRK